MGMSSQLHAPTALSPGVIAPGTRWIGGWVGLRAGLDSVVKKILSPSVTEPESSSTKPSHYNDWATTAPSSSMTDPAKNTAYHGQYSWDYPMGTCGFYPRSKVARVWSWPLTT